MIKWVFKSFVELTNQELYSIMRLRQEVFVVEQNCPFVDADNKDQDSYHLMGMRDDTLTAYARIVPPGLVYHEASIGRVITSSHFRGLGYGKQLMHSALENLEKLYGKQKIRIGAQQYLQKFYESFGFLQQGESYLEDGILHILMVRENHS